MNRILLLLLAAALPLFSHADEGAFGGRASFFAVSPVAGWDRNELQVRGRDGTTSTETDTAPEYGLFAVFIHPRFVVNNFLFWSKNINDTDIWGNLFFANYYHQPDVPVTWNVGAGYLYHKIKPEMTEIDVKVPMVKGGPLFRMKQWGITLNPYLGYAWEQVDTPHGDQDNDSYLYGISGWWRWRMIMVAAKYYYQDSQEIDENFNTFRARLNFGITKNVGGVIRFDYMEHQTTTDTSVLAGPTFMF